MPVSEKSIIDAGQVESKAPLKKSTVVWVIGIVMALSMVGYYAPRMAKSAVSAEPEVAATVKSPGSAKQIEAEIDAQAKVALTQKIDALSQKQEKPEQTPIPAAVKAGVDITSKTIPPSVAADRQASAIKAASSAENSSEVEIDSAARVSKSIAHDFSDGGALAALRSEASVPQRLKGAERPESSANSGDQSTDRLTQLINAQASKNAVVNPNKEWLKEFASLKPTVAITPKQVSSGFTLIQGKVIPAVLGKALNSDLPGDITAFTTMDVYDSLSSRHLLIPKGSMLIGEYSTNVRPGQDRLMFAFSRIVLPNGISFDLPGNKGQDRMGASGIQGDVNNHYFTRFFSGFLVAFLSDKLESSRTQPTNVTNIGASGPTSAAGTVLVEIAKTDLSRNKDVAPTITIPEGTRINVQVSADMEFPSEYRR